MQVNIKSNIDSLYLKVTKNSSIDETLIVAVSKKKPIEDILKANEFGITNFGENYAQELQLKAEQLDKNIIKWHFIGPIQSNKAKLVATHANWIHSLCREKVIKKINNECIKIGKQINGLIQINISNEESKDGIDPKELMDYANLINSLEKINLKGIMVLPKIMEDEAETNKIMNECKQIHNKLLSKYPEATFLSMGTTSDFEIALKNGSNLIRIGELIFGKRFK